eukprot:tig00020592_g11694.t1
MGGALDREPHRRGASGRWRLRILLGVVLCLALSSVAAQINAYGDCAALGTASFDCTTDAGVQTIVYTPTDLDTDPADWTITPSAFPCAVRFTSLSLDPWHDLSINDVLSDGTEVPLGTVPNDVPSTAGLPLMVLAGRSADVASVRVWLLSVKGDNVTSYNVSFAWTCGADSGFCAGPDPCPLAADNGTLELRGDGLPALSTVDWMFSPPAAGILVRFDYADLTFADMLVLTFAGVDAEGAPLAPRYIRGPLSGEVLTPCVLHEPLATSLNLSLTILAFRPGGFSLRYYGGAYAAAQGAAAASTGTRVCPNTPRSGSPAVPPRIPGYAPPDPTCLNMWNIFRGHYTPYTGPYAFEYIKAIYNCSGDIGDRMGMCTYTSRDFFYNSSALIVVAAPAGPVEITISTINRFNSINVWPQVQVHSSCSPNDVFFHDGFWIKPGAVHHSTLTIPTIKGNGNIAVIYLWLYPEPGANWTAATRKDYYRVSWRVVDDGSAGGADGTVLLTDPSGEFGTCTYDNVTRDCSGMYGEYKTYLWMISAPEGYIVNLEFLFFETEQDYDFVTVYDAAGTDGSGILLPPSSGTLPEESRLVESTGRFVTVKLYADPAISMSGIYCRYTTTFVGGGEVKPPTDPGCNPYLRSRAGLITDCSYGDDGVTDVIYPKNRDLTWNIAPACGGPIEIFFFVFDVQPFSGDRLEIFNGDTGEIVFSEPSSFPSLPSSGGTTVPSPFVVNATSVIVKFKTDEFQSLKETERGFRLRWAACSVISDATGTIELRAASDVASGYRDWVIQPGVGPNLVRFERTTLDPGSDLLQIYDGGDRSAALILETRGPAVPERLIARTSIFIAFTCNVSAVNASAVATGTWGFSLAWEGAPDSNVLVMTDFSVEGAINGIVQLMGRSVLANQRLELTNVDAMRNGSNAAVIMFPPPPFFRASFEVLLGGGPVQPSGLMHIGGKLPSGGRTDVEITGGEGLSFSLGDPVQADPGPDIEADVDTGFRGELGADDGLALVIVTHLSNEFMYNKSRDPEYAPAIGLRFRGRWVALVPDLSLRDKVLFRTFSVTVRPAGITSRGALVTVEKNDAVILRDVLVPDYLVSVERRHVSPSWRAFLAARMYSGFDRMYGKMLIHADNHFVRQLSILRIGAIASATPRYGPREGGNIVTIRGTALGHVSGEDITQVQLSGVEVARILSKNDTVIIAEAGAYTQQGESEDWTNIHISSRFFGDSSLQNGYLYNPVMMIASIEPRDGPRNGTIHDFFVQINVFNLGVDRDVVTVWFGDAEAVILDGENGQTDNYIRVATPPHAAGLVPVTIFSVSRGHATLSGSYTYNEAPAITGFGPFAAPRGPVWGGHTFTVFGKRLSDLGDPADLATVRICNETLSARSYVYAYNPDGSIVVTTPESDVPRPTGLCDVETCSRRYGCAFAPMAYSFEAPGVIDRLTPAYGSSLGRQRITVTGHSLVDPARNLSDFACPPGSPSFCHAVVFANDVTTLAVDINSISIVSSSQIVLLTPPNVVGVFTLRVQTLSRGLYAKPAAFSSVTLESIEPAEGPIEGGVSVTVTGRLPVAEEFTISLCGAPLRIVSKEFNATHAQSLTRVFGVTPNARACSTGPVPLELFFDGVRVDIDPDRVLHFLLTGIDLVEPRYVSVHGGDLVAITGTAFASGLADVLWVRMAGVLVEGEDLVACDVGTDNQTTLFLFIGSAFGSVGSGSGDVVVNSATFGISTLHHGVSYSGIDRVTCFAADYTGPFTAAAALANATVDRCDGPISGGTFMLVWGSHLLHSTTQTMQIFVDTAPAEVLGWSETNRTTLYALSSATPVPLERAVVFVVQTGPHSDTGSFPIFVSSTSSEPPDMSRPPVEFTYWQPLVPIPLSSDSTGGAALSLCRWGGNGGRGAMDGCDCGAGCYDSDCGAMPDPVASGADGFYPDGTPAYCPLQAPGGAEAATTLFVGSFAVPGATTKTMRVGSYSSPAKTLDTAFDAFQKQRNGSVQIVLMPGRIVALPAGDRSNEDKNANVTFRMPTDLPAGANVTWRGLSGARYSVVDSVGRGRVVSIDLGDFAGTFIVRDLSFANSRSGEREGGSLLVFSSAAVGRAAVLIERLNFTNCTLAPGAASGAGGGGGGGALAVRNVAELIVRDSVFAGNSFAPEALPPDSALPMAGGGSLHAARVGRVRIERTSFSGDWSAVHGGSVAIINATDVALVSVSIAGGTAALGKRADAVA